MSKKLFKILFISLCPLVLHPSSVFAVSITLAVIIDKDQDTEVSSGYAHEVFNVYFKGDATCCCSPEPELRFKWYFGDGSSAEGKTASHNYSGGTFYPFLCVICDSCQGHQDSGSLTVYAISGIQVTEIGGESPPPKRLCFNSKVGCAAHALPESLPVDADRKIDWHLLVGTYWIDVPNDEDPDMTLPEGNWPYSNNAWGTGTMYISIDGPHVPGQEDELITGLTSYIANDQTVKKFYQATGKQHPEGYDPWSVKIRNNCYYYSKTSAHNGCIFNHNGSYCEASNNPDYPPYVGLLDNPYEIGDYTWQGYGFVNGDSTLWGIDVYAYASRHEMKHHDDYTSWWGPGGVDPDLDQDESNGDNIPDSDEPDFTYSQGGPYDPEKLRTRTGTGISGFDDQIECMFTQDEWNVGSLESSDWAHVGSQWH